MSAKQENRCWPGYEPVPGKKPNSQGSCRPKAESKSSPSEKEFKAKRRKQLDQWKEEHPKSRRQAAQHLSGPDGESSSSRARRKKAPAKKRTATAKKSPAKKTPAKKVAARKSAGKKAAAPASKRSPAKKAATKKRAA